MAIDPFTIEDFQAFGLPGFAERMTAIRGTIRPKLEQLGGALLPAVARVAGSGLFPTWPGTPGAP